ncbi:pyridoxamine 5'-phosphate oxidase family protein [Planctomonas psychrotolerans]|uniref:pyridoxamine 5'-phosphate oxidase family protein n=1 Tax=Planctomonas psychrotolerans TaxID=2528712 RepID=UPI00123BBCE9|nr:pyridoxamine 5'-phosphate oxidase family protein [Planctomonas psychrotolerans]
MAQDDGAKKVAALVKDIRTAMLTTVEPDGSLVSRPMAVQEVEFDGDLWFFTDASSRKVAEIGRDTKVNVSFSSSSAWVSISGNATVVDDLAKSKELWNTVVEAWFPDGPETPGLRLVKVTSETAEYWDTPGKLATVISFLKAKATGEPYSGGDNETVAL